VEGIQEPLARSLHRTLRRAVLEHAVSERRRIFAPVLHVGTPGGPQALFAPGQLGATDHGLRTDVVAALLRRTAGAPEEQLVWLTRAGDLELQDVDAAWLAAARAAVLEAGVPLTLVIVNRHGWWDPRSGAGRTWKRLRAR
jgi:hypothetical protein